MLAGSENFIKPDRMVIRFLEDELSRSINITEASELLKDVSSLLTEKYNEINPRLLDHEIWVILRES